MVPRRAHLALNIRVVLTRPEPEVEVSGLLCTLGEIELVTRVYNVVDTIMVAGEGSNSLFGKATTNDRSPQRSSSILKQASMKGGVRHRSSSSGLMAPATSRVTATAATAATAATGAAVAVAAGGEAVDAVQKHRPFQASVTCTVKDAVASIIPTLSGGMLKQSRDAATLLLTSRFDNEMRFVQTVVHRCLGRGNGNHDSPFRCLSGFQPWI